MKYLIIALLPLTFLGESTKSLSLEFNGYLNKEFLQLLVYSTNLSKLDKIDLYKANIETMDQLTFKGNLFFN